MAGNPLLNTPICNDVSALENSIASIPEPHRTSLRQKSKNVMIASNRKDCLPIYFIADNPDDIILLSMIYHSLRNMHTDNHAAANSGSSSTATTAVVVVCGWREETMTKLLNTLTQHHRHRIHETAPKSHIWSLKTPNQSTLLLTLGDAEKAPGTSESAYWHSVQKTSRRVADTIGQTAKAIQSADFKLYHTAAPITLFTMPDWFWACVRILIMGRSIAVDGSGAFTLAPALRLARPHFECVLAQARNRFPILHVGFEYSGGDTIASLRGLEAWAQMWPKLLSADVYSRLLKRGMDGLYTSLIRLAASAHGKSGQECVDKAREILERVGGGRPWIEEALRMESYSEETCSTGFTTRMVKSLGDVVDCPIDIAPTALAVLLPEAVAETQEKEVMAARIAWKADDDGALRLALSGDSPQYILATLNDDAGQTIDLAFDEMWFDYIKSVRLRSTSLPRMNGEMAEGWRRFCVGVKGLMTMLVTDEQERGMETDVVGIKRGIADGNMTAICKYSLRAKKAGEA